MADLDTRWKQRLQNYQQALERLREAVELSRLRPLSRLEQQGLIQAFEFTHELAWNLMKDYWPTRARLTLAAHETPAGQHLPWASSATAKAGWK